MSVFRRRWPGLAAIREQQSVPHGKLVAYKRFFNFVAFLSQVPIFEESSVKGT